jgi:hypothetical protein
VGKRERRDDLSVASARWHQAAKIRAYIADRERISSCAVARLGVKVQ